MNFDFMFEGLVKPLRTNSGGSPNEWSIGDADMAEEKKNGTGQHYPCKQMWGIQTASLDLKGHINLWLTKFCLFSDVAFPHFV
jgi:hypothetical protein